MRYVFELCNLERGLAEVVTDLMCVVKIWKSLFLHVDKGPTGNAGCAYARVSGQAATFLLVRGFHL